VGAERGADDRPLAVLLDYAGVLTVPIGEALAAVSASEGIDPDSVRALIAAAYAGHPDGADIVALEAGRMPLGEFERAFAARLRCRPGMPPPRAEGLVGRMFAVLPRSAAMFAFARRLRAAGVRTAVLSNTWGGGEGYERAELESLFDTLVLSHEVGLRKPDPEIFALAARRLGVPLAACVVVDDLAFNVAAAQGLGMRGIVHHSDRATIAELEALLGLAETATPH
jgi:epoxide hydrolase-like predicted phosphatase